MSLTVLDRIGKIEPGLVANFAKFKDEVYKPGALSVKEKALIGLALGCTLKCGTCIEVNAEMAGVYGATDDELREALIMALCLSGPSSIIWTELTAQMLSK